MQSPFPKKIVDSTDLQSIVPEANKITLIPESIARSLECVCFGGHEMVAMIVTTNKQTEQLESTIYTNLRTQGYTLDIYYTDDTGIALALGRYSHIQELAQAAAKIITSREQSTGQSALIEIKKLYDQRNTIDTEKYLLQSLVLGYQTGASDVHFQVEEKEVFVKLRIDGSLQTIYTYTHNEYTILLQKIKFLAGMTMNANILPQDGKIRLDQSHSNVTHTIDVRINTMPSIVSESIVMRYLDASASISTFEEIGFWGIGYKHLMDAIHRHDGMIYVTGPTGSGKTTTLYTILQHLNDGKRKIITLEDPVEYTLAGIEQSPIHPALGYTYEEGLKAILRHDPDVILIGETRTKETAETSMNAALTGHLVFTTLHTNSAIDTITRLTMMGIQPYILAPALRLIISQRLVRKLCPHCTTRQQATSQQVSYIQTILIQLHTYGHKIHETRDQKLAQAPGCEACNHTGYKGRIACLEIMSITDEIQKKIIEGGHDTSIYIPSMRSQGFTTMLEDGIIKMLQNLTSWEEVQKLL